MPAKARQQFGNGDCDTIEEKLPDVPRFRGRTQRLATLDRGLDAGLEYCTGEVMASERWLSAGPVIWQHDRVILREGGRRHD